MIKTTLIGSFPKPDYLQIPDWFKGAGDRRLTSDYDPKKYSAYYANKPENHEKKLQEAMKEVIEMQDGLGIDILTDGEIKRENYINYHLRHLEGVDFEGLTEVSSRNGAYSHLAPTIRGQVRPRESFLVKDWEKAQSLTKKPMKMTLPGPMTVMDTVANVYYEDKKELLSDLVGTLNFEVRALADAGCKHIQIDEPLLARKPEEALEFGVKFLEACFDGVSDDIEKTAHLCCGYPDKLDVTDYPKADPESYLKIASSLDDSKIDAFSLEDAHRKNPLSLFKHFQKKKLVFGVINISSSRVETSTEIISRVEEVLEFIPQERLILAPDCGLAMLPLDLALEKMRNMVKASRYF